MAGKPTAELLRDLELEVTTLRTLLGTVEKHLDSANLPEIRERLAKLESHLSSFEFTGLITRVTTLEERVTELKRWREEFEHRGERLAVLEAQFAELKKMSEEKDRRWWQFWVGVGLVGFTFVANLVIQLILLFSRKSG